MRFQSEPSYIHGTASRVGVLLVNLGTPLAPSAKAVRHYLAEFLADPRVVEIPRLIWMVLLYGIILPLRSRKSAAKYATIWQQDGSPLRVYTEKLGRLLSGFLGERGHRLQVAIAMRYGQPEIAQTIDQLRSQNVDKLLVVPLYPQYSGTTTASVYDAVNLHLLKLRNLPELRFIKHFHDHPAYIQALVHQVQAYWKKNGRGQFLLMSFHGIPRRALTLGDPYHCECFKTGRLLAEALGLKADEYKVSFQSRFGRAQWLQPYTEPTLKQLAKNGLTSLDIICPGFVADCLETLEEIALEGKAVFLAAGGKEFRYIPALNDSSIWVQGFADIVEQHLQGWTTQIDQHQANQQQLALLEAKQRALALGAKV